MSVLAGYNTGDPELYNPDGSRKIDLIQPNLNAIQDSNNYGTNTNNLIYNQDLAGNLITAAKNEEEKIINDSESVVEDAQVATSTAYTGLDNLPEGFDPSKLNKSDLKTFQTDLMNAGYDLPEFGADGGWGAETEGAWNAYLGGGKSDESMLSIAANNENLTNNNLTETSIDQDADKTIQESVTQMDANGNLTDGTEVNKGNEVDPDAAKKAAKKEAVSQFFGNMSFGEYSNPFARR